jgi:hypothetical protein
MDMIKLCEHRNYWRGFVNTVMNICFAQKDGNLQLLGPSALQEQFCFVDSVVLSYHPT